MTKMSSRKSRLIVEFSDAVRERGRLREVTMEFSPYGIKVRLKGMRSSYEISPVARPVANTDKEALQGAIMEHVEVGSQLMTDEAFRLSCGKRSFGLYFSQGSAHTSNPTLSDVLECIVSDARGYDDSTDFDDWASQYGYETGSVLTLRCCDK